MTTVSPKDKAANISELSSNELDQVIGGAPARGGSHNGALPAIMEIVGAVGVIGGMVAGIIGSFFRGEE
jgi:bacteriocin-like protein